MTNLRDDALTIWKAGVAAVDSQRLVTNVLSADSASLTIADEAIPRDRFQRCVVVGAGKAGAGMAAAVEEFFASQGLLDHLSGWVNVPEDCVRPLRKIQLHPARPAGVNEPTEQGVVGSRKILELISDLGPNDVCLVLISGGGSALLPCPIDGISLADKQTVTRFLMRSGATIGELNLVRKQLSQIKGGGLARRSSAGRTISLIISDVIGDPLEIIASGPTVADSSTPTAALAVLEKFDPGRESVPEPIWQVLHHRERNFNPLPIPDSVRNCIIGNNRVAVDAAAAQAVTMGYQIEVLGTDHAGVASEVGRDLARQCAEFSRSASPDEPKRCWLSGGEPVVHLASTELPRKGGRNQELVLAALMEFWDTGMDHLAILSGGTDGEDGPTNAAGAIADEQTRETAVHKQFNPNEFLAINNSYPFFAQTNSLIITGPTHTNVMDLRVALWNPSSPPFQS
ncbi:glycerate kinase type-2 family protein [Thalassoroseus pseudoceratinae]|uniref:glycerate kinase type-2 family protein n=1 Tax=Thalassoroseus pseudoceratinae TaxID=2713176 RepID=UPI00142309FF|nr:DUF4147 domain-containing protein [Thalassoroseus pseudoceratinae]